MASNVLVTLEKPYISRRDGRLKIMVGATQCQILDNESMVTLAYFDAATGVRKEKKQHYIPGKYLYAQNSNGDDYLEAGDPNKDSAMVDELLAKSIFGNWDVTEDVPPGFDGQRYPTRGSEKDRIENMWGGQLRNPQSVRKWDEYDHTPIAPACVPHVLIRKIDGAGKVKEGWEYRPWDFLKIGEEFPDFKPAKQKAKVVA